MRRFTLLVTITVSGVPLVSVVAQAPKPAVKPVASPRPAGAVSASASAALTITADDVRRRVGVIADDSMMGRDTPSRGLDLTAQYVADEFQRLGLMPGGDDGTFFQRYAITRRKVDIDSSVVTLRGRGAEWRFPLNATARLAQGNVPAAAITGNVIFFGGAVSAADAAKVPFRDRIVIVIADEAREGTQALLQALVTGGAAAILLPSGVDSATFASRIPIQTRERVAVELGGSQPPIVLLFSGPLGRALAAAGVNLAETRAAPSAMVRELPDLTAELALREIIVSKVLAPNTIGVLEGTDPRLKSEYVLFTAHMDHIGITPGTADSVNNGADDDASGTVGVIELAEAFSQAGARPKRSLAFMTVSGEEKGLWGSEFWSEHPTVPIKNVVANVNMDMIGRNWADTIVAIGREHSDLGATLARVNQQHPELRMTAIDDCWPEERFYFRSDHYNFARKGVPILFFFNGVHEDYHQPSDAPPKINAEKESRILRLVYYLGREVANAAQRPKWKPESYKEIVEE
ncbi:MAG TPA: M28 family peptidase [Gemmatimonadales bacterium]|nr:M28 family peptidase [Gemmatimonadales bacterium]